MKFASLVALASAVLAADPFKVEILTPQQGGVAGVLGANWMIDIVVESTPMAAAQAAPDAAASSSSTTMAAAAATAASPGAGSYSSSSGGWRKRAANAVVDILSEANGYIPFLNSPSLSTFKPGPNPFAPGLVVLVNTSSTPEQNFAGVFQLNAITNSDSANDFTEGYYQWFISEASFGKNVNSEITAFFVNGTAPSTISGNPADTPNIISNIATSQFFINGDDVSNTTSSSDTPLDVVLFTPRDGERVGVNGLGWEIDLVVGETTSANRLSPAAGVKPGYSDNTTTKSFGPGSSTFFPGLVAHCNVTGNTGAFKGPNTNLAGLFQINAVTDIANSSVSGFWSTWLVGAAFGGEDVPAFCEVFVVNGTAPATLPSDLSTLDIISQRVNATFTIAGNSTSSSSSSAASSSASASSSGSAQANGATTVLLSIPAAIIGFAAFFL